MEYPGPETFLSTRLSQMVFPPPPHCTCNVLSCAADGFYCRMYSQVWDGLKLFLDGKKSDNACLQALHERRVGIIAILLRLSSFFRDPINLSVLIEQKSVAVLRFDAFVHVGDDL